MKKKTEKWFKTAFKLYRKGKLQSPYDVLFRYYLEIDESLPFKGPHGHFEYFSMLRFDGILERSVNDIRAVLPKSMLENYIKAFEIFQNLGEEPEFDDLFDSFYELDDFADEHAEEIAIVLRDHVTDLINRHAF